MLQEIQILYQSSKSTVTLMWDTEEKSNVVVKELAGEHPVYDKLKELRHPYLPRIYSTKQKEGVLCVTEEYIDGAALGDISLSERELSRVFLELCCVLEFLHAVTADNPFLYYFNQSVLDMKQSPFETILLPQYFYDRERIETYHARIENIVNQFMLDWKLAEASESEKVRRVHDYFCRNISYDTEALSTNQFHRLVAAHSIIGLFARKKAVCEGIAKAVKLILNTAGVKCILIFLRISD